MIVCKHCSGANYVKNGYVNGKQRYKCTDCFKTFRIGDQREKYSFDKKCKVIDMYTEGIGIRSIERLEKVPSPLIIKWIRRVSHIVKNRLSQVEVPEDAKKIKILELDELFSYCKKNLTKSTYGLLLIGTEIVLLTSK